MEEPNDTFQDTTPSISSELGTQKNLGNKNRDLGLESDASWHNDSPRNEFDDDEEKSENKGGTISQFGLGINHKLHSIAKFCGRKRSPTKH